MGYTQSSRSKSVVPASLLVDLIKSTQELNAHNSIQAQIHTGTYTHVHCVNRDYLVESAGRIIYSNP